jgi:hypothetical protein
VRLTIGQLLQDMYGHMEAVTAADESTDDIRQQHSAVGHTEWHSGYAWKQQQQQFKWRSKLQQHRQLRLRPHSSSSSGSSRKGWRQQQQRQPLAASVPPESTTAAAAAGFSAAVKPRVVLYSAHDTSLMPLLAALGQQQRHW